MTSNISFFGASVTKQKTGYAEMLKQYFKDENIFIHGFGSCHIVDAGICNIDDVLTNNPDYCFIDWFTTGWVSTDTRTLDCLNTIIKKFSDKKCKLIFLFLLRKDHEKRIEFYNFMKNHLNKLHIAYIDINDHLEYSESLLRDIVHTTDEGSEVYAKTIFEKFNIIKSTLKIPNVDIETKYSDLKMLPVNKIFHKNIIFDGDSEIVCFELEVGPNSSAIQFNDANVINIWDQWCHYKRNTFKIIKTNIDGNVVCNICTHIDTSSCTKDINFDEYEKFLDLKKIYYIGNDLKIIDGL